MAMPDNVLKAAIEAAKPITDADVFVYNGTISAGLDLVCIESIAACRNKKKATLFLTTHGGDPDAAYKLARYFQEKYEYFTIVVAGRCKSAGTLIALGANELAFTPYGELGPLDIQVGKVDRFDQMQSGLTIQDSLNTLEERALDRFYKMVSEYINANQGMLSFNSATKAAADFITQLYAPVFSRIDPEEVGARARSMRIATDYGKRLSVKSQNLKEGKTNTLKLLAETYSSHSFVIDRQEAMTLFKRVREATPEESAIVKVLGKFARFEMDFAFHPLSGSIEPESKRSADHDQADQRGSPKANGGHPPGANGATEPPSRDKGRGGGRPTPARKARPASRKRAAATG